MVNSFICGTSSFPLEEDDFERQTRSADSSPQKTRSKRSNKNPYSRRGLDKFSALLAEIEEKRQQIYSQVDPNEISLVRFVYAGDHDVKPIVVKVKGKAPPDQQVPKQPKQPDNIEKPALLSKLNSFSSIKVRVEDDDKRSENEGNKKKRKLRVYQWNKEPNFYLAMIVIFILVILVLFGRSFAIMCTSIGWYIIPSLSNISKTSSSSSRLSFKKKNYATRRMSDKKLMTSEGTKSFKTSDGRT